MVVTVASDVEWEKFRSALGDPVWAREEKFATTAGRKASEDEIDLHITAWTKERDPYEVMEILQKAGVAAGPALSGPQILGDPHLAAREFLLAIDKAEAGTHLYPGFVPRFHDTPCALRLPAPCFGEHHA